jgi:hypothetical protein
VPRAVVLPSLVDAARGTSDEEDDVVFGARQAPNGAPTPTHDADKYAERLVKYIPGEVLPFFLLLTSSASIPDELLILAIVAGGAGTVLYGINRNHALPAHEQQPTSHIVWFGVIAFAAWALGTSLNVQELVGVSQTFAAGIMAILAFLLPGIDDRIMQARGRT